MALRVVLDACVLYPVALRDCLLRLAELDLLQIVWSRRILDEMKVAILRRRPDIDSPRIDLMIDMMRTAFPEAEVDGWEALEGQMLNHPDDLLCRLLESSAPTVIRVIRQFSEDTSNPPMSVDEILQAIGRSTPLFAERARALLSQLGD